MKQYKVMADSYALTSERYSVNAGRVLTHYDRACRIADYLNARALRPAYRQLEAITAAL